MERGPLKTRSSGYDKKAPDYIRMEKDEKRSTTNIQSSRSVSYTRGGGGSSSGGGGGGY